MKSVKNILLTIFITTICLVSTLAQTNTIAIDAKEYQTGNGGTVSTRELAMLASLVYEDVPNDDNYTDDGSEGCIKWNGKLEKDCFYKEYNDSYVTLSEAALADDDSLLTKASKKSTGLKVFKYIEGMSERKTKSIVSAVTSAFKEDGEEYYFLNFAHASELEESGWTIYDYATIKTESGRTIEKILGADNINFQGVFDAVTFKRGDNYVIAYRGTDYPDLLEWIQDVGYAFEGEHAEAAMAYKYAQDVYSQIVRENSNAKIYVTGHSLGAYLAQVGGAAIIDKEAGISYVEGTTPVKTYQTYDQYGADYYKANSRLVQVAYFNGMGIGGVFSSNNFITHLQNALVYLSTYSTTGQMNTTSRKLNYSNIANSSGRLVLYSMEGDPISAIGFHYGEIYKLETAADAITNHRGRHDNLSGSTLGEVLPEVFEGLDALLEGLDSIYKSEVNKQLISIAKSGLTAITGKQIGNISPAVVNQVKSENNGVDITRFNLGSLVDNLNADLVNFSEKYGISNLFDHFNANHETDSFSCLKDANNGYIENIKIEVDSARLTCEGNTCYTNKVYSDRGFTFTDQVITNKYEMYNVTLKAVIDGACAKRYTWYASADGRNWETLGTTVDNKIIVPQRFFGSNTNEGTKTYYFKVSATYGDSFTELKSTFESDSSIIKYATSSLYQTNPTINDGVTNTAKTAAMSDSTKVSLVTDKTKPSKCTYPETTQNVELSCGFLGLSCSSKRVNLNIKCTDDGSNVVNSGFNNSSVSIKTDTKNAGLFDSIELVNPSTTASGKKVTHSIKVQINRKPLFLTPKVVFNGKVTDKAGNSITIKKTTVNFKITKD